MEPLQQNRRSGSNYFFLSPGLLAAASFFVMVFIMGLLKIYSPDLGFHLQSARWIIDNKQFIHHDTFNYVAEGSKYYDMQWLYQLFIYLVYNSGGEAALIITNSLLITYSLILVWIRFKKVININTVNIKSGIFAFMALLFVQALPYEIRPHVLSWIFLNLVLLLLESYKRGNGSAVFILPLVMLVWANTHSLSILGLVTIGIYNAGNYFEKRKVDKKLLLGFVLSSGAFLITPYFIEGLLYTFSQFQLISGSNLLKSYIAELQSPFTISEIKKLGLRYFISPLLIIHISALLSLFSIIRSLKQKQFTDTLLLITFLIILYLGNKNYGYYLMVSLPLIVKYSLGWRELSNKKKDGRKIAVIDKKKNRIKEEAKPIAMFQTNQKLYKRLSFVTIIIAFFISVTSITDGYPIFRHSPFRFGFTVDKDQLPVEATAFLNNNQIKGRLLNHLDFGGYLATHYNEKVFIDGRLEVLPESFFKKYFESLTVKDGIKNLLSEYDPGIIIFPYVKASNWWAYFLTNGKQAGYKAVYFDGLAVVYLKASMYPQLPELNEKNILAALDPAVINRMNSNIENSKPEGLAVLINGLWKRQSFSIADQNKAIYCFTNGFETAAQNYSVMGIERSTVHTPNIFRNLTLYYQDKKMYELAQLCREKSE